MNAPSTEFNPFQAPVFADAEKTTLGEDDQFLVSKRDILCRDRVELPKVCIRYGETEDLERRQKILRMFTGLGLMAFAIAVLGFLVLLSALVAGRLPFSDTTLGMLLFVVALLVTVPAVYRFFRRFGCCEVDAVWFVGPRYRRRIRWERRIGRAFVLLLAAGGGFGIAEATGSVIPLVALVVLALVLAAFFDPNISLQLVGRRRGVYVLRGHSKAFCHEVNRLISGY